MKAILLDADGVVLNKGEYFSVTFAREYSIPESDVMEFFKGPFISCSTGSADLKEELIPYLEKWHWDKGVDAFLDYWFNLDLEINSDIIGFLDVCKSKGIKCYLASNNEKYRAEFITKFLQNKKILDGYFYSSQISVSKSDPEFFKIVLERLKLDPHEVGYFDNDQKNIDAALFCGIKAELYTGQPFESLLHNA